MQAPRGDIVDREGRVLVATASAWRSRSRPTSCPPTAASAARSTAGSGKLLDMRPRAIERRVNEQFNELPFSKATVKQDVPRNVVMYIAEREEDSAGSRWIRSSCASTRTASSAPTCSATSARSARSSSRNPRYSGVAMGDRVGKAGLEAEYDRFLRGRSGATKVQVDALGNLTANLGQERAQQGSQLRLSLDLDVQRAGQEALEGGTGKGAFAVMDIHNGEVLGLGSEPSYDPNLFAKVVRKSDYDRLTDEDNGDPLTNRAVAAGYPTGSTFKLITATAALESGLITPDTPLNDPGELTVGDQVFKNAGDVAHGVLSLRQALTVSSDVFFYQLGRDMNEKGMPLQHWARKLGLGRRTGIDLPEEGPGFVPGPKWRDAPVREVRALQEPHQPDARGDRARQVRLAGPALVGGRQRQPLGRPGRPRRQPAADGRRLRGDRQRRHGAAPAARPADRELRRPGRAGPRGADRPQAQHRRRSTARRSSTACAARPARRAAPRRRCSRPSRWTIAGKTGTAEKGAGRADQSWYVALAPWPDPKYVVAVTDEAGGFGADTAAPMARRILAELFNVNEQQLVEGGGPSD